MKRKKEYTHLIKTLTVKKTPDGLYKEPRLWVEGKDLEGFRANISYGFIKKTGSFHPVEGAVIHPYDECLVFAGIDNTNIKYLGAEISIELGEEREVHVFDKPSVLVIPKGLPHGPVTVKKLEKPIVHYHFGLALDYKAQAIGAKDLKSNTTTDSKYSHLIKPLITNLRAILDVQGREVEDGKSVNQMLDESGMGYMTTVFDGVMRTKTSPKEAEMGPGNADELVWLFGKDLEGLDVNFTWGYYSQPGKWHRGGEAHTHPEEEILIFVGLDPDNIEYMGAEVEIAMGENDERHFSNKPFVAICPKGFPHLPVITRWVDKPYSFFVICLSGTHASPWEEK
ncbi:MAG: hypothetical protein JXN64_03880 [Spirochaetes bacterium]|nr:hypothetical protein [Spirochaetota bacterium]